MLACQAMLYLDHPDRRAEPHCAENSRVGVACRATGGSTAEVTSDNSTAGVTDTGVHYRRGVVSGIVINPKRQLHYTIDEEQGSKGRDLARVIFYHQETLARAAAKPGGANVQLSPAKRPLSRRPLTCCNCGFIAEDPAIKPAHWVHHWDAAVDKAGGRGGRPTRWRCWLPQCLTGQEPLMHH